MKFGQLIIVFLLSTFMGSTFARGFTTTPSAQASADLRAAATLSKLTLDEKLGLLRGHLALLMNPAELPVGVTPTAGLIFGVPRLGVPHLIENDASLGIASQGNSNKAIQAGATALPSGSAMAATWDPQLVQRAGAMIGSEARSKGINILLGGGVNLVREPRNGRNFEYLGEDPLLAGVLGGHAIRGIQSSGILSTIKHYALNNQETGRGTLSVSMDEAAMRESDLLAFELAIEIGDPGSVMCAYNRINRTYACENDFLLNQVLRRDWGYKGFVMSDWGAVHSVSIRQGLDQESGTRSRPTDKPWFGKPLRDALAVGEVSQDDIDRSVRRILRTIYAHGLDRLPIPMSRSDIDFMPHAAVAQQVAESGIVLLKNDGALLPIAKSARHILVVGAHADMGVLSGGGSSQVWPTGGAALALAIPGEPIYHRRLYVSSPLLALRELLPTTTIDYDDGTDPARAAAAARSADLVVVFAEQFAAEGRDMRSLSLPDNQDALIDTVATANPRTVVVLETGGPVLMPWLNKVGAVAEAWYAGQRGGPAIARMLTGEVNPSGRLPMTFPVSVDQLPNPKLPGSDTAGEQTGPTLYDLPNGEKTFDVTYPEGADVGYRWYDRTHATPLFAFGYGLSYTSFAYKSLKVTGGATIKVAFQLSNTGTRRGIETAQVYARIAGIRRLIGWKRVPLEPGQATRATIAADPRLLARFDTARRSWRIAGGRVHVEVSTAFNRPRLLGSAVLATRHIKL